jgi:hypothetical protein
MTDVFETIHKNIDKYKKEIRALKDDADKKKYYNDKMELVARRLINFNNDKLVNKNNFKEQLALYEDNLNELETYLAELDKIMVKVEPIKEKFQEKSNQIKTDIEKKIMSKSSLWDNATDEYLEFGSMDESKQTDRVGALLSAYEILLHDYNFFSNPEHYNSFGSILTDINGNVMIKTIEKFDSTITYVEKECSTLTVAIDKKIWLPDMLELNDISGYFVPESEINKINSLTDSYMMRNNIAGIDVTEPIAPINITSVSALCLETTKIIETAYNEPEPDQIKRRGVVVYYQIPLQDSEKESIERFKTDGKVYFLYNHNPSQTERLKDNDIAVNTEFSDESGNEVIPEKWFDNLDYKKSIKGLTTKNFNKIEEILEQGGILIVPASFERDADEPVSILNISETRTIFAKWILDMFTDIVKKTNALTYNVVGNNLLTIQNLINWKQTKSAAKPPDAIKQKKTVNEIHDDIFNMLQIVYDTSGEDMSRSIAGGAKRSKGIITNGVISDLSQFNLYTRTIGLLKSKMDILNNKMETYWNLIKENKLRYSQIKAFLIYLMTILKSPKILPNLIHFKYINAGYVDFYLMAINKILKEIDKNNDRIDIVYFKQFHYITLRYLQQFLTNIRNIFGQRKQTDILDLTKISDDAMKTDKNKTMAIGFLILNNFKDIIESHREANNRSVTIYARVNDREIIDPATPELVMPRKYFSGDATDVEVFKIDTAPNLTDKNGVVIDDGANSQFDTYCGKENRTMESLKFTQVFDNKYPTNDVLSKYMSLETQINKRKGIMLITYGYSGTGKTYTLFGKTEKGSKTDGILQATLSNIKDVEEVRFRLYELHGYGVAYPHYWKGRIEQQIYSYDINVTTDELLIRNIKSRRDIAKYIKSQDDFAVIPGKVMDTIFSKFSVFVDEVDKRRKAARRICITPNNPESSRSIIVYEFNILVDNIYIPFVIVDLPGREEIIETYVNTYVNKPWMKGNAGKNWAMITPNYNTLYPRYNTVPDYSNIPFYKSVLTSMTINPLALGILVPSKIFEGFNNLSAEVRNYIAFTNIPYEMGEYSIDEWINTTDPKLLEIRNRMTLEYNAGVFSNEAYGYTMTDDGVRKPLPLSKLYNFSSSGWDTDPIFKLDQNQNAASGLSTILHQDKIIKIVGSDKSESEWESNDNLPKHQKQISTHINSIQYQGVVAYHLINRMILLSHFESLGKIYKYIIDWYFSDIKNITQINTNSDDKMTILTEHNKMLEILKNPNVSNIEKGKLDQLSVSYADLGDPSKSMEAYENIDSVRAIYDQIFNFRSYVTPFEGIYINENIMGLIKVLATIVANNNESIVKSIIPQQDVTLNFKTKRAGIREHNYILYKKNEENKEYKQYENIYRSDTTLKKISKENSEKEKGYAADKIFKYDEPFVESIFNMYQKERTDVDVGDNRKIKIANVVDYKIFYLFSNNDPEKKCAAQIRLLKNTKSFVDMIGKYSI